MLESSSASERDERSSLLRRSRPAALLHHIEQGVCCETGERFFPKLVEHLARALGVAYAFVSELSREGSHFRSRALWARGRPGAAFEAALEGRPCHDVLLGKQAFHPDRLQQPFPVDRLLSDWRARSYAGVPLVDRAGAVIGHVACVHDQPLGDAEAVLGVLRIFAVRAALEIEWREEDSGARAPIATLAQVERRHIESVLRACGSRIEGAQGAAARLDLAPSTLRSRMQKLGVRRS